MCKILLAATQVQAVRQEIIELNGVGILLKALMILFPLYKENEKDSIVENFLFIIENILIESHHHKTNQFDQMTRKCSDMMEVELDDNFIHLTVNQLDVCLKRLLTLQKQEKTNKKIISALTRILPFLSKNHLKPNQFIVDYFEKYVHFEDYSS